MTLEVKNLSFEYPNQILSRRLQPLLHNISFQLSLGEALHLQGQNGAGKTTLLKLIVGLLYPSEGYIYYNSQDIHAQRVSYQHNISYLGHKTAISHSLSVMENCKYDLQLIFDKDQLEFYLHKLELWSVKDLPCNHLSAGQKRRIALLRLMLSPSVLWLLDEPLAALDEQGVELLMDVLHTHVNNGGQVVYSSHQSLAWVNTKHQVYSL